MRRGKILAGVLTALYIISGLLILVLHKPDADEWSIERVAYDKSDTYILQSRYDDGLLYYAAFGRMAGGKDFHIVWQVETDEKIETADFIAEDKVISILALDRQNRKVFLFRKEGAKADEQVFLFDAQPVKARLRDGGIYVLTADNQIYYTTLAGETRKCNESASYIYDDSGKEYRFSDIVDLNLSMAAQGMLPPFIIFTLAYFITAVMLLITCRFIWREKKLMYQTLAAITFAVFVMLFVLFIMLGSGDDTSLMPKFWQMALVWLLITVLLFLYLWAKWRPVEMVMEQMDRVARGDYRVEHRHVPNNEFGRIWGSVERMCRHLQSRDYHNGGMLECLQQYAPRNFEKLFGRAGLEEVKMGETVNVPATVCLLSVIDHGSFEHGGYIGYADKLIDRILMQSYADKSVFLTGGGSVEKVKAVFMDPENSSEEALRYSIECIESMLAVKSDRYSCEPLIMLHRSEYLCGLAGGMGQVYPFIASKELDLLGKYVSQFKKCGVRLVITEQTKRTLAWADQSGAELRYIGHLSEEEVGVRIRLYEMLDVYKAEKREAMLKAKEKFDEAVSSFYAGHYRRAEKGFVDALKGCPEDGIARWYALACEKILSCPEQEKETYGLFF